jgi:hypothetical protein
MRELVASWTHGEDWQTWVAHSVIAVFIAIVASLIAWAGGAAEPVIVGVGVAIGYYLIREIEQTFYAWVDRKPIDWKDNIMDVLAPAATVLILGFAVEAIAS